MPGQPVKIGPFVGGMNTYSGPTSIGDNEAVELLNVDIDLDGTVLSRPPLSVSTTDVDGPGHIIGIFRSVTDVVYIIYAFATQAKAYDTSNSSFVTIGPGEFTAAVQYNDSMWLVKKPSGTLKDGTKWNPVDGATTVANMPRGVSACIYKERMFISASRTADTNSINRVKFSNPADPGTWTDTDYFDVSAGDGQDITKLIVFDAGIVIFKSDSTYLFAYESAPTRGQVQQISSSLGANNNYCVLEYENNLFVMHEANVYRISNWNWEHANIKVPFEYSNKYGIDIPDGSSISILGNRLICRYFDNYYVLGLKTGAWVKWEFKSRSNKENNPSFDVNTSGWIRVTGQATITRDTAVFRSSPASARLDTIAGSSNAYMTSDVGLIAANPGEVWTTSVFVAGQGSGEIAAYALDATNTTLQIYYSGVEVLSSAFKRFTVTTGKLPSNTAFIRTRVFQRQTSTAKSLWADDVLTEKTDEILPFIKGSVTYAPSEFVGNPTLNPATGRTKYFAASYATGIQEMYTFEDVVAVTEEAITSRIVTKSYDFGPSYSFKRLFWWGVDILSKTKTTFKVTPVIYHTAVTWGQLVGVPFSSLGTWGRPLEASIDVSDSISSGNPSSYRTFVKLLKSLRFRQIQFTLESTLDGTSQTGPLRVFSLTAFVDSRETVVKKVS